MRHVALFDPPSSQAKELAYLLRIVALERTLYVVLIQSADRNTLALVHRAWRWLLRSDRIIDSVPDAGWREYLRKKKTEIETRVSRSRKAVHIAARTSRGTRDL